ncbi:MAG: von Willebrand factor type A domain-containing protein [Planctomycetota bacterium]
MNPDDDPRVTAYVLDELSGADRDAFEAELRGDPALADEVEGLRSLLGPVTQALREHPALAAPASVPQAGPVVASRFAWHRAAAAALAAATLWWAVDASSRRPRESTRSALEVARLEAVPGRSARTPMSTPTPADVGTPLMTETGRLPSGESRAVADRLRELASRDRGASFEGPGTAPVPLPIAPPSGPQVFVARVGPTGVVRPKVELATTPFGDPANPLVVGGGEAGGVTPGLQGKPEEVLLRSRLARLHIVETDIDLPTPRPSTGDDFETIVDPGWRSVDQEHTSTFSMDVDTASLAIVRRMVREGRLPPADAVRIEELLNAFDYGYAPPQPDDAFPLRMHASVVACPWDDTHRLVRLGIKAREIEEAKRPPVHLVFLVDVSGSMKRDDRLPLAKHTLTLLLSRLRADDRIAIVAYANQARVVLPSTSGADRETIQAAIDALSAGGSTNGAGGLQLAYEQARAFADAQGAVRRVLLLTDGDFNVGVSDNDQLEALIAQEASTGVWLSVFGMGMGNVKDARLERLSNRGNGTYAYLDTIAESQKVLVEGVVGTLIPVAKDAKVQVFFNPERVGAWRLLGYANRRLAKADFSNDQKDAGDVGAGHEVTALYEIIPAGVGMPVEPDENPFVAAPQPNDEETRRAARADGEDAPVLRWRLRAKAPTATDSTLVEGDLFDTGLGYAQGDADVQWAAGVAAFGAWLRREPSAVRFGADGALELLAPAAGNDAERGAFVDLAKRASTLAR